MHRVYWLTIKKLTVCSSIFETGCLIPKTSLEWTAYFTLYVETWSDHFLESMDEFAKLSDNEIWANKERSKNEPPIDLESDICFDAF